MSDPYDGRQLPARTLRWVVVTAVAVVAVVLACVIAFVAFTAVMRSRTVPEHEARVGQCVDLSTFRTDGVNLVRARCDEPHDAEVIWVGQLDGPLRRVWRASSAKEFCAAQSVDATYAAFIVRGGYSVGTSVDSDDPGLGDWAVCYLEPIAGRLEEPLR